MTNQHAGNEWFRRLVKSNRPLYRSCPKHTKILVAKAIVQAVQQQDPPGRFLEVADKHSKTWKQIPYKRCVDKTSQALREREQPEKADVEETTSIPQDQIDSEAAKLAAQAAAQKQKYKDANLHDLAKAALRQAGLEKEDGRQGERHWGRDEMDRKRKAIQLEGNNKPPWWRPGIPNMSGNGNYMQNVDRDSHRHWTGNGLSPSNKRSKADFDEAPLPPDTLGRQSSLFRFLSGSRIFGKNNADDPENTNQMEATRNQQTPGFFPFAGGTNSSAYSSTYGQQSLPNPSDLISLEATAFEANNSVTAGPSFTMNVQQPLPFQNYNPTTVNGGITTMNQYGARVMYQQQFYEDTRKPPATKENYSVLEELPNTGLIPPSMGYEQPASYSHTHNEISPPPPANRISTQVSDWLTSFWPLGKEQDNRPQEPAPPPPPSDGLERSISSTIINLARSPSQFLTALKSGVTSIVFGGDAFAPIPINQSTSQVQVERSSNVSENGSTRRDSLLDDYEETPMEARLRTVTSL